MRPPRHPPPRPTSHAQLARALLLAALAIGAATWGLVRHLTARPPPFYVPAREAGLAGDTLEAPELEDDAAPDPRRNEAPPSRPR